MVRTILVPLDFSEGSRRVVTFAAALASQLQAALVFVNVLDPSDLRVALRHDLSGFDDSIELRAMVEKWVSERFAELVPVEIAGERLVVRGGVVEEILELAGERKADLVVIGTRGRGMTKKLLGSTVESVIERSPVPVTVVR